jgi:hypothetical protein
VTKESDADPVHYCDWLSLMGFMKEQEALQTIRGQGIEGLDEGEWQKKIRQANLAASMISGRLGVKPDVRELDPHFNGRVEAIKKETTFQEHLIGVKTMRFALVEMSKLRCSQTMLNTEYVESLTASAPPQEDLDATVKFCLPTRKEKRDAKVISVLSLGTTSNTSSLISENLDFRVIGKVDGEEASTGRRYTGFGFGFGLPQMSVVEYKNQLIIKNGHHRAYALFKKGHKFLPCLLATTDNFQSLGIQGAGFFPVELMLSDWSPMLSDFDTDVAVPFPRRRMRVMITIHAETQVVPA